MPMVFQLNACGRCQSGLWILTLVLPLPLWFVPCVVELFCLAKCVGHPFSIADRSALTCLTGLASE